MTIVTVGRPNERLRWIQLCLQTTRQETPHRRNKSPSKLGFYEGFSGTFYYLCHHYDSLCVNCKLNYSSSSLYYLYDWCIITEVSPPLTINAYQFFINHACFHLLIYWFKYIFISNSILYCTLKSLLKIILMCCCVNSFKVCFRVLEKMGGFGHFKRKKRKERTNILIPCMDVHY